MYFDIYKKSFNSGDEAIWWGNETHYRAWDESTMYLYFFIVFISFFAAWKCDTRKRNMRTTQETSPWFSIISVFLLLIMGLRGSWVGMDTIQYSLTFEGATSLSAIFNDGTSAEPLYKIFMFILRSVFESRYIAIFILSFFIVYFVFKTIKLYYNSLCLTVAIPAFVCLYYFQSYNLIRITIAASFLLWRIPLLVNEKYKKYAIYILIAMFIHFSTFVLFFPLGLLILYKKSKSLAYSVALGSIVLIVIGTRLLGDYITLLNRYENYVSGNESSGQIGFALFLDYLPCLIICIYVIKNKIHGHWADMMLCFTIAAFIIRMLAYFISAAGRLHMHFMPLTLVLLPYWLNYIRIKNRSLYHKLVLLCIMWIFIRLHIYFTGYLSTDGIMPYNFYWNE